MKNDIVCQPSSIIGEDSENASHSYDSKVVPHINQLILGWLNNFLSLMHPYLRWLVVTHPMLLGMFWRLYMAHRLEKVRKL